MKIAILTSKNQWFESYALQLSKELNNAKIYKSHNDIQDNYDIVFILSYHQIIPQESLLKNNHNIVIHASLLPKGKGWAPLFWQILEGKNIIPFTMFEASSGADNGDVYTVKDLELTGYELNEELREKQAKMIAQMCLEFVNNYEKYKIPYKQVGNESFYLKRVKEDSGLDIDKTIREQFNLFRIINNSNYPAYFELDGNRYVLKIELDKSGGGVDLIDFVDLTLKEKLMVLNWRNSDEIKKWMYSQDVITIEGHISFIDGLRFSKERQYLLVKKENKYVGVVNFTSIDFFDTKQSYFGLYANPFEKMAGVGRVLEEVCIKYVFDLLRLNKLKLEVFSDNLRAINLYEKYNFKEVGMKNINDKKVICMELVK
jgi:UDP-4-amino-4,6-dideoxy-N-acetyl-beta-L-altrosamine N-acetyltransferase